MMVVYPRVTQWMMMTRHTVVPMVLTLTYHRHPVVRPSHHAVYFYDVVICRHHTYASHCTHPTAMTRGSTWCMQLEMRRTPTWNLMSYYSSSCSYLNACSMSMHHISPLASCLSSYGLYITHARTHASTYTQVSM